MSVKPYARPRPVPFLGVLLPNDAIECEDGATRVLSSNAIPKSAKVYAAGETSIVDDYVESGRADAICWNHNPIRLEFPNRSVIIVSEDDYPDVLLDGLVRFRDWLATYGAAIGSMSASAFSLLRATLPRSLFVGKNAPPLHEVIGGRIERGLEPGFYGAFEHWDLSAAYATTLGALHYPGTEWFGYGASERVPEGVPCFQRADVRIPSGILWGPLPRHFPKRASSPLEWFWQTENREYPSPGRCQGIWNRDELRLAAEMGCRVYVRESWAMLALKGRRRTPFAEWFAAIREGRKLPGLAGSFAKQAGNSLWSRFAINGVKTRVSFRTGDRVETPLPIQGSPFNALDVSELVTSAVRERVYRDALLPYGDRVWSVHTDGVLLRKRESDGYAFPAGWRRKYRGLALYYGGPQSYAFTRSPNGPTSYCVAGVPDWDVPRAFWAMLHTSLRFPTLDALPPQVVRDIKEHFPAAIEDLMRRTA